MKKLMLVLAAVMFVSYPQSFAFSDSYISQPASDPMVADPNGKITLNEVELSMIDHKALVYLVRGTVQILKKDATVWAKLSIGDIISEGDQIKTGKDSLVELYYDKFHLNHARIDAGTFASFDSIEPTSINMMEGNLFNMLGGIPKGSAYEISTPKAVASVRGTRFSLGYDPANQTEKTSVLNGTVQVLPYVDAEKRISAEKYSVVNAEEALDVNHDPLHSDKADQSKPHKMESTEKEALEKSMEDAKTNLIVATGGTEEYGKSLQAWARVMDDDEKISMIKASLQEHGKAHMKTQDIPFVKKEEIEASQPAQKQATDVVVSSAVVDSDPDTKLQDSLVGAIETTAGDSDE
ncbi:MAG: hypothetical protein EXS63_08790 [Candidatus Omnitrophica bacterium]|nr:hypothetical protein [Candidatus Omnitrophota bacterium]